VGRNNFINLKERRTLRKKGIYKRVTEKKKETMPEKENKKGKKDKGKNTGIRTDKNW
jgi:hypothetical protein